MRKNLRGAHVAVVGLGSTQGTFTSSVANGKSFDEVWAINSMMVPIKHDRVFMMDPASRFLDTENAGAQTDALRKAWDRIPGRYIPVLWIKEFPALFFILLRK